MIDFYQGNIFKAPINILIHSCNCYHKHGAGIAKDIKIKYPRSFQADCLTPYGSRAKLGQFYVTAPADDQPFWILGCYTQHRYGRDKQYVEYDKFSDCMENVKNWVLKMDIKNPVIGIPYHISCQNAGGSWEKILSIIRYHFSDCEEIKVIICKKIQN